MQNAPVLPWNNEIHNTSIEACAGFTAMRLQLSFEDFPIAHPWGVKLSFNYGQEEQRFAKKEPVWWNTTYLSHQLDALIRAQTDVGYMKYQVQEEQNVQTRRKAVPELCLCQLFGLYRNSVNHSVIQWNCVSTETWNTLSAFFHPDTYSSVLTRN